MHFPFWKKKTPEQTPINQSSNKTYGGNSSGFGTGLSGYEPIPETRAGYTYDARTKKFIPIPHYQEEGYHRIMGNTWVANKQPQNGLNAPQPPSNAPVFSASYDETIKQQQEEELKNRIGEKKAQGKPSSANMTQEQIDDIRNSDAYKNRKSALEKKKQQEKEKEESKKPFWSSGTMFGETQEAKENAEKHHQEKVQDHLLNQKKVKYGSADPIHIENEEHKKKYKHKTSSLALEASEEESNMAKAGAGGGAAGIAGAIIGYYASKEDLKKDNEAKHNDNNDFTIKTGMPSNKFGKKPLGDIIKNENKERYLWNNDGHEHELEGENNSSSMGELVKYEDKPDDSKSITKPVEKDKKPIADNKQVVPQDATVPATDVTPTTTTSVVNDNKKINPNFNENFLLKGQVNSMEQMNPSGTARRNYIISRKLALQRYSPYATLPLTVQNTMKGPIVHAGTGSKIFR